MKNKKVSLQKATLKFAKSIRQRTAEKIFEEQLEYVEKELRLVHKKQKMERDNIIWKQDEGNLREWKSFIEKQKSKFLQEGVHDSNK